MDKNRNKEWAPRLNKPGLHNFYMVSDSIYRSEQPYASAVTSIKETGIKSILNLRNDRRDSIEVALKKISLFQVNITTTHFTNEEIIQSLRIIATAPKPLLIHCKHGSDRTGVVIATYRIIFQKWPKEKALKELRKGGYHFHSKYRNIPEYIRNVDVDTIRRELDQAFKS